MWRKASTTTPFKRHEARHVLALMWAWAFCGSLYASEFPRDSVVVDGSRVTYLAEVDVDTTQGVPLFQREDWWFGVGWDVHVGPPSTADFSTLGLPANRPLLFLEHQQALPSGRGRLGVFLGYFQPWALAEAEVSSDVKGWIESVDRRASSPLRQVVLTPDSLAYERDTLMAPLSPGHALRLGLCWEGQNVWGWWPRLALSADVIRPQGWTLMAPPSPGDWPDLQPQNTFHASKWFEGRFRAELGGVMDVGQAPMARRAASQLRAAVAWVPGMYWGVSLALMASPTRR
jgi:hypothetical protein